VLQRDLFELGICGILELIVKDQSLEDFYGNFLTGVYHCVESGLTVKNNYSKPVAFLSKKDRRKGIKRKIRRRGYNDKGSRRQSHENHGIPVFVLSENELEERERLLQRFPPPKEPRALFFYKTLNYGDGRGRSSTSLSQFDKERSEEL
jgi:hypothetical protein